MTGKDHKTCFVLMPFKEPFDFYFKKIIKPAVEANGFLVERGDSLYRSTTIMDDVWNGIRKAAILVAELTERNPNVFYELGLAHALSKPVVLISEKMEDVPFDLRSIRVLLYDRKHPEWGSVLKRALSRAIKEVVKDPAESIPATFKTPVQVKVPEESALLLRLSKLEQALQGVPAGVQDKDDWLAEEHASVHTRVLKPGDIVSHNKFGRGTVVATRGTGNSQRVQVNFDEVGLKWMMPSFLTSP